MIFLLGGVNRRKNDYQSFFLRLQVIRPNPEGTRSKSADREAQIPRNSRSEKRKNTPQGCVFFSVKGLKKDIFGGVLTGFELNALSFYSTLSNRKLDL